jgi:hypothetical protein
MERKDIDDAVDSLDSVDSVQCGEDEVASLGGRDSEVDCFKIAHFSNQDHVRILAQDILERVGKRLRVDVQFTLIDQSNVVVMDEFDWVFDRHDMNFLGPVDTVDHRSQCRRLARSRRSSHEYESSRPLNELIADLWQVQILHILDFVRNHTKHGLGVLALNVHVSTEPRHSLNLQGEI